MGWTLWTIVGVLMVPVVVAGLAVGWRDRRRRRDTGSRLEHPAEGDGTSSAWLAHIGRGMNGGGGGG